MDIAHTLALLCIERGRDMSPLWLSLWVASIALIIVILSGLATCYWMNRCKWGGIAILDALITLPLVLPPVVVGFALLMVFTPGYAFGAWLEAHGMSVVFAASGAVIASSVIAFPLFYQTVRSALQSVDHNMEDVARTLGASELRTTRLERYSDGQYFSLLSCYGRVRCYYFDCRQYSKGNAHHATCYLLLRRGRAVHGCF